MVTESIKYTFKNNVPAVTFCDDHCYGGGDWCSIEYSNISEIVFNVEEETKGRLFKRKVENYSIYLKFKYYYKELDWKTKTIHVLPSEKSQAIFVCDYVNKLIAKREEDNRKREEAKLNRLRELRSYEKSRIICLDVETTGLDFEKDEILQLSIINGNGDVCFNDYIKPRKRQRWSKAQEIHGITPQMVKDKPTIDVHIPTLNQILENADLIIGYNSNSFDLEFIRRAGVTVPNVDLYDVMLEFAPIYGKWDDYHGDYMWQKLSTCARYYKYKKTGEYHDSLEDVKATLHCFYAMIRE